MIHLINRSENKVEDNVLYFVCNHKNIVFWSDIKEFYSFRFFLYSLMLLVDFLIATLSVLPIT